MSGTRDGRAVGVDVGGTKTQAVVLGDGGVLGAARVPTVPGVEGVVASVLAAVRAAHEVAGTPVAVERLGVGVPGVVDARTGHVTRAVNLGIGDAVPLGHVLAEATGARVVVENDVNAAAVGAARAVGLDDLAYLSLGTGLAAGLVLDGRLRRGPRGSAGEVGHLPFRDRVDPCPCGQRGCCELYASGGALERLWPSPGEPAPVALAAAVRRGDRRAVETHAVFVEAVAWAVRSVVLGCGVTDVLLGGGVAALGDDLVRPVRAVLAGWAADSPFLTAAGLADAVRLAPAEPLGALGAAVLAAGPRPHHLQEVP